MNNDYKVIKKGLKSLFQAAKGVITNEDQCVCKEVQQKRQSICDGCPYQNKKLNQCTVCKCFLSFKTKLKRESCPKDKWDKEE